jgi:CRP-like cAMP-binding protein
MLDLLAATAHLPERRFAAGEVVLREGEPGGALWVLVRGTLRVRKGAVEVNRVTRPGAVLGEVSLLLGGGVGATVEAAEPSVLRHAADGQALLDRDPAVARAVAVGLAERLNFVTTYLADLKTQYGEAPGLAMVTSVLAELAQHQVQPVRSGSAREPDPEY